MAKVLVKFIAPYGRNTIGDTTVLEKHEFERLSKQGVVVNTGPKMPPRKAAPLEPVSKNDPEVRGRLKSQERESKLPGKYSDLWSLASLVATEIGGHNFASRDTNSLRDFLLENWNVTEPLLEQ